MLLVIIAALYVAGALILTAVTFKKSFESFRIEPKEKLRYWDHYEKDHSRYPVSFYSGKNKLLGHVYEAKKSAGEESRGLIVFSHGIWSGPEEYLAIIMWFVDRGWDVFTYSYTSYNGGDGRSAKGLPQSPIDLDAALRFIESDEKLSKKTRVLMGHSWGAYATAAVLAFGHDAAAAVTLSGFSDPVEISVDVAESILGKIGRTNGWCVALFNRILFGSRARIRAVDGINAVNFPVLVVHGENDDFINYERSSIICHRDSITNPKTEYLTLTDPEYSSHNNYFTLEDFDHPNLELYEQIEAFIVKSIEEKK